MAEEARAPEQPIYVGPDGKLTDEGARYAIDWVNTHWPEPRECPFHPGPTPWSVDRSLGSMPGYRPVGFADYTFPVLLLKCGTCGFMAPLNAIQIGLIPADPESVAPSPASTQPAAGAAS